MRIPDFFIVGAAKSGTTSLYRYLDEHPEISMPQRGEPLFFATDLNWPEIRTTDLQQYLSIFANVSETKRMGDKSVFHLYSCNAAREINAFNPKSQIIIMLRNPVEMVYSHHSQLLRQLDEDITNFEKALDAEKFREIGQRRPRRTRMPEALLYSKIARYSEQIQRYIDVFGRSRIHIIIFDDFRNDMRKVYKDVLKFLNVDTDFTPQFDIHNPAQILRSRVLQRILIEQPIYFRILPLRMRLGLEWRLQKFNKIAARIPPLKPETQARLQNMYLSDVEKLSLILDRDLTFWCQI